ncbi:ATP-binding protein [Streptomyces griseorubiginosus]|uniref:ATP-binding protein n=1 Tax=Streptomyces griseorubiginosus TaxID=67304 RepID=UPI0033BF31BE
MTRMVPGRGTVTEQALTLTHLVQHLEDIADTAETSRSERREQLVAWMAAAVEPDVMDHFGNPAHKEVLLPAQRESARAARQLTRLVLMEQWHVGDDATDDVVFLVSELVANAVRHTGARVIGLRLRRLPGCIRIEVRDPSRALPCLLQQDETGVGGRGLHMVDRLADRWGVDLLPRGKAVWFEIRFPPAQAQT